MKIQPSCHIGVAFGQLYLLERRNWLDFVIGAFSNAVKMLKESDFVVLNFTSEVLRSMYLGLFRPVVA